MRVMQLDAKGLLIGMESGLGGAVNGSTRQRHKSQPRRCIDDGSMTLRFEKRQELLDHPHWPQQINFNLAADVLEAMLSVEAQHPHHTGVVNKHIEIRKIVRHALIERDDGRRITDVALVGMHVW